MEKVLRANGNSKTALKTTLSSSNKQIQSWPLSLLWCVVCEWKQNLFKARIVQGNKNFTIKERRAGDPHKEEALIGK